MGIAPSEKSEKINEFYTEYFSKNTVYEGELKVYKDASSSRTRSDSQRNNRLTALLKYCNSMDACNSK
jgi:hypothetical protein